MKAGRFSHIAGANLPSQITPFDLRGARTRHMNIPTRIVNCQDVIGGRDVQNRGIAIRLSGDAAEAGIRAADSRRKIQRGV